MGWLDAGSVYELVNISSNYNNNLNPHFRNPHFRNPHLTSKTGNVTGLFIFYQHIVSSL